MESCNPPPDLKAYFLVGSTAVGKTAVSQWIAEHYSFDILSADAMMVYRGMDIGTAKPDQGLRGKVRYWGLDLVAARDHFDVGLYRTHALHAVREAAAAGRRIIVAGGTGLYLKCLTHGLSRLPAENKAIRIKADQLMLSGGIAALQEWARARAPAHYETLADKTNSRRIVRAVEIAQDPAGGQSNAWRLIGKGPKMTGLLMPMPLLYERIKLRVEAMYAAGLVDEVKKLLGEGFSTKGGAAAGGGEISPTAGKAIGYAEVIGFLQDDFSLDQAMATTLQRTRQLAKRQMTWFRHQADVEWLPIDPGLETGQIARLVMKCWEKIGPTAIVG